MSVYSMTGFATASASPEPRPAGSPAGAEHGSASVTADLRSVNGRFLDLSLKLPDELRGLEPALRERVGARFKRGKIELRITTPRDSDEAWPQPRAEQLSRLSHLQSTVRSWLPEARHFSVNEVLHWCRQGGAALPLNDVAMRAAEQAIEGLREARAREGARLVAILTERIAHLRQLTAQAAPLVPAVVQRQQQRFLERWHEALAHAGARAGGTTAGGASGAMAGSTMPADALRDRALAEAAAYALRIDVAEELARLAAHLDEITRLLEAGGELGKRLDFLIQELHREANTLGSKSSALELTNISVEMKVAIEQMREQVQNIE